MASERVGVVQVRGPAPRPLTVWFTKVTVRAEERAWTVTSPKSNCEGVATRVVNPTFELKPLSFLMWDEQPVSASDPATSSPVIPLARRTCRGLDGK